MRRCDVRSKDKQLYHGGSMEDRLRITHVFFDVGGTLAHPDMDRVSRAFASHGVVVPGEDMRRVEHLERRVLDDPNIIRSTTDQVRWNMYFEGIFRCVGVKDDDLIREVLADLAAIHRKSNLWDQVHSEVYRALMKLRDLEVHLGVISNANGTIRRKLHHLELLEFFETVVDSGEEKVEKPDPEIFHRAMDRMEAEPLHSLYVGDMYHIDVVGAKAAGMHVMLLDPGGAHFDRNDVVRISSISDLVSWIEIVR